MNDSESFADLYKNFKELVCFKNAICTISTNIEIDINKFNNYFGGQLTTSLPGIRVVISINGERYSYIIYGSGKIVLTNLYYINDMSSIYNYFNQLFLTCIKMKIGTIKKDETLVLDYLDTTCSSENDLTCNSVSIDNAHSQPDPRVYINIKYVVENFQFSFHIDTPIFMKTYKMFNSKSDAQAMRENEICANTLANHIYQRVEVNHNIGTYDSDVTKERFPADMITFYIWRPDNNLMNTKSGASRKRKKNTFDKQTCSIHIFRNGKFILTGVQTKTDLEVIREIMLAIIEFFFPTEASGCTRKYF